MCLISATHPELYNTSEYKFSNIVYDLYNIS